MLESHTLTTLQSLGIPPDAPLLVAVSGGVDSMSLLTVLHRLWTAGEIGPITAFHLDHSLREESGADANAVATYAQSLDLPLVSERLDINQISRESKLGIEETARMERYRLLVATAAAGGISYILTAHHRDDLVETVLMRIARGTGVKGLGGIAATRRLASATLVRPWLDVSRVEIEEYSVANDIPFREDASNASLEFERNRVRHILMPALAATFPNRDIAASVARLSSNARDVSEWMESQVGLVTDLWPDESGIQLPSYHDLAPQLRKLLVEWAIRTHCQFRMTLSQAEWERIELVVSQHIAKPSRLQLRDKIDIVIRRGRLMVRRRP